MYKYYFSVADFEDNKTQVLKHYNGELNDDELMNELDKLILDNKAKYAILVRTEEVKRSALDIANEIGVYGAFGKTLSDLYNEGK